MSAAFQLLPRMRQVQSQSAEVLTQIFEPDVNLAIWQRDSNDLISAYAQSLSDFQALQFVAEPKELTSILEQRLPEAEGKTNFIADLELLSQMLACLMDCTAVGFRLKRLEKAMCPRFHTDHVALRLLVTYSGAGTEWQSEASALQHQQIGAEDVALLKGSAWNDSKESAIWHRSPQTTQPRLLLSLDPVGE
ncbi:hypothetical protein WH43_08600 [Rheinheimera sp. KL1]|uniref:DUF1826 domain-containing protein n=1 Tax=Rheinheimera sp. KL1 TaxID=1635005 RepID=UPI0006A95D65|nr:DUF1826 domain-containing protein [Rheinheimera sp. KL1]KOO58623.1 hypothetical protein WH43_08600 [Rheinheimera sp. KL1]